MQLAENIIDLIANFHVIATENQVQTLKSKFNIDWIACVNRTKTVAKREQLLQLMQICKTTKRHLCDICKNDCISSDDEIDNENENGLFDEPNNTIKETFTHQYAPDNTSSAAQELANYALSATVTVKVEQRRVQAAPSNLARPLPPVMSDCNEQNYHNRNSYSNSNNNESSTNRNTRPSHSSDNDPRRSDFNRVTRRETNEFSPFASEAASNHSIAPPNFLPRQQQQTTTNKSPTPQQNLMGNHNIYRGGRGRGLDNRPAWMTRGASSSANLSNPPPQANVSAAPVFLPPSASNLRSNSNSLDRNNNPNDLRNPRNHHAPPIQNSPPSCSSGVNVRSNSNSFMDDPRNSNSRRSINERDRRSLSRDSSRNNNNNRNDPVHVNVNRNNNPYSKSNSNRRSMGGNNMDQQNRIGGRHPLDRRMNTTNDNVVPKKEMISSNHHHYRKSNDGPNNNRMNHNEQNRRRRSPNNRASNSQQSFQSSTLNSQKQEQAQAREEKPIVAMGRGRGRVSNLPAWMTAKQKQKEEGPKMNTIKNGGPSKQNHEEEPPISISKPFMNTNASSLSNNNTNNNGPPKRHLEIEPKSDANRYGSTTTSRLSKKPQTQMQNSSNHRLSFEGRRRRSNHNSDHSASQQPPRKMSRQHYDDSNNNNNNNNNNNGNVNRDRRERDNRRPVPPSNSHSNSNNSLHINHPASQQHQDGGGQQQQRKWTPPAAAADHYHVRDPPRGVGGGRTSFSSSNNMNTNRRQPHYHPPSNNNNDNSTSNNNHRGSFQNKNDSISDADAAGKNKPKWIPPNVGGRFNDNNTINSQEEDGECAPRGGGGRRSYNDNDSRAFRALNDFAKGMRK